MTWSFLAGSFDWGGKNVLTAENKEKSCQFSKIKYLFFQNGVKLRARAM